MYFFYFLCLLLYLDASNANEKEYRLFDETTQETVKEFYRINHQNQTLQFVLDKKKEYLPLNKGKMSIWKAIELFDTLVDESDPDLDLPQRYHMFQTAEAVRKDGHPRWLILTAFLHDLGKILACYGEPQWAVVGDTFPVGCKHSEKIVFAEYFAKNSDTFNPIYQTLYGIYSPACGLNNVHMSWGHDEYLYQVVKDYLPKAAGYIIRYHSFYSAHQHHAYLHLMNEQDLELMPWVELFSHYDLYSKSEDKLDLDLLMPFYLELVSEFFPDIIDW